MSTHSVVTYSNISAVLPEINKSFSKKFTLGNFPRGCRCDVVKGADGSIILSIDYLVIAGGIEITRILTRDGGAKAFKKVIMEYQEKYERILLHCPRDKVLKFSMFGFSIAENRNKLIGQKMFLMVWIRGFEKYTDEFSYRIIIANYFARESSGQSAQSDKWHRANALYCNLLMNTYGDNTWSLVKLDRGGNIVKSIIFKSDKYSLRVVDLRDVYTQFTIMTSFVTNIAVMNGLPAIFPTNDMRGENMILKIADKITDKCKNKSAIPQNIINLATKIMSFDAIEKIIAGQSQEKKQYVRATTI